MDADLKTVLLATSPARAIEVCDVGANPIDNAAPYAPLLEQGLARVTGFEPQESALARLNAAKSDAEVYLSNALGTGKSVNFNVFRGSGFSSCYDIDPETVGISANLDRYTQVITQFHTDTSRLDDLAEVPQIDMLKIDVQGSELNIIANARSKLGDAICVWTEVRFFPLYKDEPDFGDLQLELAHQGFRLHNFDSLQKIQLAAGSDASVGPRYRRQLLDGDAIYFRDLRSIQDWSDHQVRALFHIATSVTFSMDVAAFAIAELVRREKLDSDVQKLFNDSRSIRRYFPRA